MSGYKWLNSSEDVRDIIESAVWKFETLIFVDCLRRVSPNVDPMLSENETNRIANVIVELRSIIEDIQNDN